MYRQVLEKYKENSEQEGRQRHPKGQAENLPKDEWRSWSSLASSPWA